MLPLSSWLVAAAVPVPALMRAGCYARTAQRLASSQPPRAPPAAAAAEAPPPPPPARPHKLFVGRLPQGVRAEELAAAFASPGAPAPAATVLVDGLTGRSRGFGFLAFARAADAAAALARPHWLAGRLLALERLRPEAAAASAAGSAADEAAGAAAGEAAAGGGGAVGDAAGDAAAARLLISLAPAPAQPPLPAEAARRRRAVEPPPAAEAPATAAAPGGRVFVLGLPLSGAPSWSALRGHMRAFGFAQFSREVATADARHAVFAYKRPASALAALGAPAHAVEGVSLRVVAEEDVPPLVTQQLLAPPAVREAAEPLVPAVELAPAEPPPPLAAVKLAPAPAVLPPPIEKRTVDAAAAAALASAESDLRLGEAACVDADARGGQLLLAPSTRAAFEDLFARHGSAAAVAALLAAAAPDAVRARGLLQPSAELPLSVRLLRLSRYLRRKQLPAAATGGASLKPLLAVPRLCDVHAAAAAAGGDAPAAVRNLKREAHERLMRIWSRVAPRAARVRAAEAASRRGGWREATAPPAQPRVDELLRRHASALGSDESSAGSGTDTEAAAASAGGEAAACSGSEADIPLDGGSSSEAEEAELPLAAPPFAQGQRLRAVAPPPPPPPQSRAAALFRRALPGTRGSTTRLLDQRLR